MRDGRGAEQGPPEIGARGRSAGNSQHVSVLSPFQHHFARAVPTSKSQNDAAKLHVKKQIPVRLGHIAEGPDMLVLAEGNEARPPRRGFPVEHQEPARRGTDAIGGEGLTHHSSQCSRRPEMESVDLFAANG